MKINNCIQLLDEWAGTVDGIPLADEDHAKQIMEKYIFKYTECGCVFDADENGVYVAGYAEGSDAELFVHSLNWGFTIEEYNDALAQADAEGVEEWERANEYDLARLIDEKEEEIEKMYKDFGGEG